MTTHSLDQPSGGHDLYTRLQIVSELEKLAAEASFMPRDGVVSYRGDAVVLRLIPLRKRYDDPEADIEARIDPLVPFVETDEDIIAGIRAANFILGFHDRPAIREAAAESSRRMDQPRLHKNDFQGHTFVVYEQLDDVVRLRLHAQVETDERGRTVIPQISCSAKLRLCLRISREEAVRLAAMRERAPESPARLIAARGMSDRHSLATTSVAAVRTPSLESQVSRVEYGDLGQGLQAKLFPEQPAAARFEVSTDNIAWDGAAIQYVFGDQAGELTLRRMPDGHFSADAIFRGPLRFFLGYQPELRMSSVTSSAARRTERQVWEGRLRPQDELAWFSGDLAAAGGVSSAPRPFKIELGVWRILVTRRDDSITCDCQIDAKLATGPCVRFRVWRQDDEQSAIEGLVVLRRRTQRDGTEIAEATITLQRSETFDPQPEHLHLLLRILEPGDIDADDLELLKTMISEAADDEDQELVEDLARFVQDASEDRRHEGDLIR